MHINQILWVISGENHTVTPVQVIEKVTKETALGVKTEFIVRNASGARYNLAAVKAPYFESSAEVYEYLSAAADALIKKVIASAEIHAQKFAIVSQNDQDVNEPVQNTMNHDIMNQEEQTLVTLPDGRQAKVRIKLPEDT